MKFSRHFLKPCLAIAMSWCVAEWSHADVLIQASGTDFLAFEAESFDSIEGDESTGWLLVDTTPTLETDDGSPVLPSDSNVSGTAVYDQNPGGNFVDLVTWKLQFATPGVYTFYMRYSMFSRNGDGDYGDEDSMYMPLDFGELPEQVGWFGFGKQGHDDPLEDPPYWEGQFHWGGPYNYNEIPGPVEYEVTPGDVGNVLDFIISTREGGTALDAIVLSQDPALTEDLLDELLDQASGGGGGETLLLAGDADQDLDFDQIDLVKVQIAAKYLTGAAATWGEGDWDAAPQAGGVPGNPPTGDGMFNQLDIIGALAPGHYLTGPYAAINTGGTIGDEQTSIVYNTATGEVSVDAPAGTELTSINIDSAGSIFTGEPAQNLGGSFDNDTDSNIFKATFGSSFGSLSFGNVAQTGLSEDFLANDLTVIGSLAGGGDLGPVDLVFIPEPSSLVLLVLATAALMAVARPK